MTRTRWTKSPCPSLRFNNSLPQLEDGTGSNDDQMMTMIMVVVVIITMPDHQMMMADLEEAGWRKIQPKKVFMDCNFTINTSRHLT